MRIVWMLAFMLAVPSAFAESTQCDAAKFDVDYTNKSPMGWEQVRLSVINGQNKIAKDFEYVHYFISCLKNASGKSYIVYQAYCGGSGCKDFDNWGIIEPLPLRVLPDPSDNNHGKAEKIFGGTLTPFFARKKHHNLTP